MICLLYGERKWKDGNENYTEALPVGHVQTDCSYIFVSLQWTLIKSASDRKAQVNTNTDTDSFSLW